MEVENFSTMASSRQLKTKLQAVGNIKQMTRAMELVAATKMRKAQEVALGARSYAKKAFALLAHLLGHATREELSSVFWQARKEGKIALVVVTSDKGLCGSFNSAVLRAAAQKKEELDDEGFVDIVAVGKKGRDFFKARYAVIAADFFQFSDIVTLADISPLAEWILQAYEEKRYDKIVFCSMRFVSALVQRPVTHQVLPLDRTELEKIVEGIIPKTGKYSEVAAKEKEGMRESIPYVLEPSARAVINELVQDLVRVEIVHLIFESNASEHSARMVAMKNATDNAEELLESLTLALNKARQGSITQELAEITSAKEALTNE